MEPKNFLKWFFPSSSYTSPSNNWFFHPNPSSVPPSKDIPAMSTPDDKSPLSPPQAQSDSVNASTDPDHVAADQLAAEVQQLCLKPPESDYHEDADGKNWHTLKENDESLGEAESMQDHGTGGAEDEEKEAEEMQDHGTGGAEDEEKEAEEMQDHGTGGAEDEEKHGDGKKERLDFGIKNKLRVRPEPECAFYLKGTCKFGSNCKFNHPILRKPQAVKEKIKDKEESKEKTRQADCKYYLMSGGCKYGNACRYNHSKTNFTAPAVELNFVGLPIRLGEKECPFYMRTGTCKFSANCKFSHPDPTSGAESPMEYGNDGSASLENASHYPVWSPSGTQSNECPSYVPMMYPPTQVASSANPEWNDYQQHTGVVEFPERPGQHECSYFLKAGDCNFKSNCKYHHGKWRTPKSPQNVCSYYRRYGICKSGPACKFVHSAQLAGSGLEMQPSMESSL
ncbi:hypothetical protein SAY87_003016 [Trapa incisa]|uniref:C3H1-type domain-containing protein n=1 Tax=Trapa incisa TaxID=236973 RepID=A0AAN7KQP4_9MYRT|nr:hypothetical protein SAY87_003016 [Trapa incisa]